jgi:hypothetical protein
MLMSVSSGKLKILNEVTETYGKSEYHGMMNCFFLNLLLI